MADIELGAEQLSRSGGDDPGADGRPMREQRQVASKRSTVMACRRKLRVSSAVSGPPSQA